MGIFDRIPNTVGEKTDKTVIAKGTRIVGRLDLEVLLLIDGEVEGEIVSASDVSVGTNGHFKGDLRAKKVIVSGKAEGTVACERLEILSSGTVTGTAEVRDMTIEPGGRFFGQSREAATPKATETGNIKSNRAKPEPAKPEPA
jgi:cytoskeletal protein CcmA (bactofilin family)